MEILAPATPDHSMTRWLGRAGGAAGWVLSTQVPSLDGEHGTGLKGELCNTLIRFV